MNITPTCGTKHSPTWIKVYPVERANVTTADVPLQHIHFRAPTVIEARNQSKELVLTSQFSTKIKFQKETGKYSTGNLNTSCMCFHFTPNHFTAKRHFFFFIAQTEIIQLESQNPEISLRLIKYVYRILLEYDKILLTDIFKSFLIITASCLYQHSLFSNSKINKSLFLL